MTDYTKRDRLAGRSLALEALAGRPTRQVPVGVITWGFEYYWQVAGLAPWQLACGSSESWHKAHVTLYERHRPDLVWYSGGGSGPKEPTLLEDTELAWVVKDNNTGEEYEMIKGSLARRNRESLSKNCDPVGAMESREDVNRLIPEFTGWGEIYLGGLRALISELGDRALVLPHHSPGYICACYAFGFGRAMELMLTDPDLFIYVCDRYASGDRLRMQELADAGAEAVYIADGWASCDIISPRMFDRFALPYQKSIAEAAHAAGLRVILWNEGNVLPILDREAALDIDAFGTEQPRKGADTTVAAAREVFGPNRCLFGNLDSEHLLRRNDTKEIERAVCEQIAMSGPGAPFILSTGSPIPSRTEPEAVDTVIRAARSLP